MPITGITIEADSVVVKGSDFDALCGLASENNRLRQELSLAEEGLANYAQEVEQLKAERDQWKKRADELFFAESPGHPGAESAALPDTK